MLALVDSDAFAKLGIAGLMAPLLEILGVGDGEASRLPALPHMLRRGSMRRQHGASACDALVGAAEAMGLAPPASTEWLQRLTDVPQIDAGEAQLLGSAAEHRALLITGDKRALIAVARVSGFAEALAGCIVTVEAALLALCNRLGEDVVRTAVTPLLSNDRTLRICFSPDNAQPGVALVSYLESLKRDVAPLILWDPVAVEAT